MGKFTRLFALIILLLSTAVYAQYDTIKIWNGLAPGSEAKENKEKWDDSLRVYAVYQPDVTVFLPSGVSAETPGVIICPGGGYRRLVMEKEGYKVARLLNKSGIACFVLKYRLVPEEALEDVQRTVSFVRFNSKKYNLDPNKIGVMGFSAGGHVVGNLSTHYQKTNFTDNIDSVSSRPDFVIGIYPYIEPRDTTPASQY